MIFMKYFVSLVFIALLLTGCSAHDDLTSGENEASVPFMTGLIFNVDNEAKKSILVVEGTDDKLVPKEEWQGNPATVFYITDETQIFDEKEKRMTFDDLRRGYKVKFWITGDARESYPSQADASVIQVIESISTESDQESDGGNSVDSTQGNQTQDNGQQEVTCDAPKAGEESGMIEVSIFYSCKERPYLVYRLVPETEKNTLQAALEVLLEGPTNEEKSVGFSSWFSEKTEGLLQSVTIEERTVIVDFTADLSSIIPNASTSAGSRILLGELNSVVFTHSDTEKVVYQFNGSTEKFCSWMQMVCEPFTREKWEDYIDIAK